jgi:aminoglycoside/choline kinase family phosphotransferase
MYAPVGFERVDHFIAIDNFLCDYGLSAPKIIMSDEVNGMLLLEDFGDDSFRKILINYPNREFELYKNAIDLLIELQQVSNANFCANHASFKLEEYSEEILLKEVMLFAQWYLLLKNKEFTKSQEELFKSKWVALFNRLNKKNKVIVLRDYHADNLMNLSDRKGIYSVGLLDFQDALIGSAAYDLVSLLEDARRDVSKDIQSKMLTYFIEKSAINKVNIITDYEILSLQRNIKILGIFARLSLRDKKDSYLELLPRVEKLVSERLQSCNLIDDQFREIIRIDQL